MMQEDLDKIDDYVLGRMAADDKIAFELRISEDEALAEEVEFAKIANELGQLSTEHEVDDIVRDQLRKNENSSNKGFSTWVWLLLGALLFVPMAFYWFYPDKENEVAPPKTEVNQIYASLYVEPIWPLERGETDSLQLAVGLHLSERTEEGLAILLSRPDDIRYKYWAAEVLVHEGRCKEAVVLILSLEQEKFEMDRVGLMKKVCKGK